MSENPTEEFDTYLHAVINTAVEAIIIIDRAGVVETFNPASEKVFGYSSAEVCGHNVRMLMPAPYREEHDGYLSNYLRGEAPKVIGIGREVFGQRKNGDTFPMHLSVSEVITPSRQGFVGIVRDLTELKQLQNAVVSQSERERAAFGQDLHDVLAQQLTALSLLSKTLEKKLRIEESGSTTLAEEIVELSKRAMDEARRLAHGLYPTELAHRGLVAALHELAENQSRLWNLQCRVYTDLDHVDLDQDTALHLYRIAQEAVSNAIKHGEADQVRIALHRKDNELLLEIVDNGGGMDQNPGNGMGTSIMKHRASLITATLELIDEETGVRIRCRLRI